MRARNQRVKERQEGIAAERIEILLSQVEGAAMEKDLSQADYLINLAREIGKKSNVRIPREYKRLYCKHCYRFIRSTQRSKTRVNPEKHRVEVYCLSCKKKTFYPIKGK